MELWFSLFYTCTCRIESFLIGRSFLCTVPRKQISGKQGSISFGMSENIVPGQTTMRQVQCENSPRKQPSFFAPGPSGVSREGRLRFTAENSLLMTKICPASGHERGLLVRSVIMHNKVRKYAGQWKFSPKQIWRLVIVGVICVNQLGLTSLQDFDGSWDLSR